MPILDLIMDGGAAVLHALLSLLVVVGVFGSLGIAGAWAMSRRQPCNPYGYDACACGCGTNCEEAA